MINPKEVGERLNTMRQERSMSQQAIAALMNVRYPNGKRERPCPIFKPCWP